jgi:hypothetical protein
VVEHVYPWIQWDLLDIGAQPITPLVDWFQHDRGPSGSGLLVGFRRFGKPDAEYCGDEFRQVQVLRADGYRDDGLPPVYV